jgi:hypothetical protein
MVFYEPEVLAVAGPLEFGTRLVGRWCVRRSGPERRDDQPVSASAGRSPAA